MVITAQSTKQKPGYKQTEVGEIPEDWEVKKLGEIGECLIGLTYQPSDVKSDGLLVLRASNIGDSGLIFTDIVYVDVEVLDKLIPRKDDLPICVRNGSRNLIGKCALIDDRAKGMTFGAFMSIFRTKYAHFVFYQFQSKLIKRQIHENIGATINQITNRNLNSFLIPFPKGEEEQHAIATTLSDIDALIVSLDRLIAKKGDIKQAVMQQLLTGKTRLPGFSKELKPAYKQTEAGVIPGDWKVTKLGEVAQVKTGPFGSSLHEKDYVDDGTPIITVEHLGEQGVVYVNIPMVSDLDRKRLKAYSLLRGDIVFSRVGSVDRNSLIKEEESGWLFSGRLLRIRVKTLDVYSPYLSYYFNQEPTKQRIRAVAVGQTMASLNTQILKSIDIAFPSTESEQRAIATVLSDMDAEIAAIKQKLEKLRALKQGIMQELLTGRTRLV
jgi:type I restriction enzyme, S subunit